MYIYIYDHIYICIYAYLHIYTLIHCFKLVRPKRTVPQFSVTEHRWTWWDLRSANTASPREWPTPGRWVKKKGCHRMVGMRIPKYWKSYIYIHTHIYIHIHIYIYTHITIHIYIYIHNVYIYIYGCFHKWGYPNCWMVYFMENPIKMSKHG